MYSIWIFWILFAFWFWELKAEHMDLEGWMDGWRNHVGTRTTYEHYTPDVQPNSFSNMETIFNHARIMLETV